MATPQEAFLAIPPVTRVWLAASVLSSLGHRFGLLNPMLMAFDPVAVISKFEVRARRPWGTIMRLGVRPTHSTAVAFPRSSGLTTSFRPHVHLRTGVALAPKFHVLWPAQL
jgi:hypothetical protein